VRARAGDLVTSAFYYRYVHSERRGNPRHVLRGRARTIDPAGSRQSVECPTCGAEKHQPCVVVTHEGVRVPMSGSHVHRPRLKRSQNPALASDQWPALLRLVEQHRLGYAYAQGEVEIWHYKTKRSARFAEPFTLEDVATISAWFPAEPETPSAYASKIDFTKLPGAIVRDDSEDA
jgi:hypothetical protein